MDEDLKTYLQGMETRIDARIQAVEDRTAALIAAEVGNIHTEMQLGFAHVDARLDSIDSRLKLQAGLVQSGARAMALASRSGNGQA